MILTLVSKFFSELLKITINVLFRSHYFMSEMFRIDPGFPLATKENSLSPLSEVCPSKIWNQLPDCPCLFLLQNKHTHLFSTISRHVLHRCPPPSPSVFLVKYSSVVDIRLPVNRYHTGKQKISTSCVHFIIWPVIFYP